MEEYIKIKAFADLTGLSVRTLQYYDEINLLEPAFKNEHGHRFYTASSFSKVFVIQSLKDIGMSLENIKQYLDHKHFDITQFIQEEKRRTKEKITDLQLKLLQLERLENSNYSKTQLSPYLFPLLLKDLLPNDYTNKVYHEQLDFNLSEWQIFLDTLSVCRKNNYDLTNKLARECVDYWEQNVLDKNEELSLDNLVVHAENYYQNKSHHRFGMTTENYQYLNQLLKLDKRL